METIIGILTILILTVLLIGLTYSLIRDVKTDIELKKSKKRLEENFKKFEAELEEAMKSKPVKEKTKKETTKRKVGRPKKGE